MEDREILKDYVGRQVRVLRDTGRGFRPIGGVLQRVGTDIIEVRTQRQEIGDGGFWTGRMLDEDILIPLDTIDNIALL